MAVRSSEVSHPRERIGSAAAVVRINVSRVVASCHGFSAMSGHAVTVVAVVSTCHRRHVDHFRFGHTHNPQRGRAWGGGGSGG